MFTRIVVPLDGTEHAERALPVAARIARATRGSLFLVRVVLPPIRGTHTFSPTLTFSPAIAQAPTPYELALAHASSYLHEVLQRYASVLVGIKIETEEISGAASSTIFQEARLYNADLIVLCSRGETGLKRWIFSSIAQQSVRHSPACALVLNEHGLFPPFHRQDCPLRVLLPLDGSPCSETALEPTIQLLAALVGSQQAVLHLFRIVAIPLPSGKTRSFAHGDAMTQEEEVLNAQRYLHTVIGSLQGKLPAGLNLTLGSSVGVERDVATALLTEANASAPSAEPYDLMAMATHGRSGLQRLLMGSVTEHLLGATQLPLLIVRPHEVMQEEKAHV
ncbi:MAG TPA: universal stress protein [Ktedonobacteraceae bacterium]